VTIAYRSPISLRRSLLLRVGTLVAATAVLVGATFLFLGVQPMKARIAESQFSAAAAGVAARLTALFAPMEDLLRMSRGWLGDTAPSTDEPDVFNRHFQPVLATLPQATSVVAGTSTGQAWLLLRQPDGVWHNRLTDIPRWGMRHRLTDRYADGRVVHDWQVLDYDARRRPWYTGALTADADLVAWTAPYVLFTTGDPGITAAIRTRLADGRDLAIGFDVMLRDLSKATMAAQVGQHGLALVVGDTGKVLALPAPPPGIGEPQWLTHLLEPTAALNLAPVDDALGHWRRAGRPTGHVMAYRSGGGAWLARIDPYRLGDQRFWVVALAPASDFGPAWAPLVALLAAGGLVTLMLALLLARRQAALIAQPLEELAAASSRLGERHSEGAAATTSDIVEVDQIANAQATATDRLRDNREKLADQESRLRRQLDALRDSEAKYRQLFDSANDGIFVQDNGVFIDCNERGARMYGLRREEVIGRSPGDFCPEFQPNGLPSVEVAAEMVRAALAGQPQSFEWQPLRADGQPFDVEITLSRVDVGGRACLQAIVRDITERKQAEEEIRQLAYFDPLTELPNRRLLLDRLNQALMASRRSQEFGALIMLDLDHFKILNDTLGHDGGDRLLIQVARRLLGCVRANDTVARLGGDEYILILAQLGQDEPAAARQAELLAEKIGHALHEPYALGDGQQEFHCTASLGVTLFGGRAISAEVLLKQADMALYKAKDAGCNAIRFFNPAMQTAVDERAGTEAGLRQALAQGQFALSYQPQFEAATGRIVAVEALLRWRHPDGLRMPDTFISVAEESGLIVPIGDWVLATACRQLAAWRAAGVAELRLAVNLSARQLRAAGLLPRIQAVLADNGLTGGDLELEITESTAMHEPALAIELLRDLTAIGVRLAIDDFGTGYSSLTHLRRLPIQTLKVDRSFVLDIEHDDNAAAICAATISLAHNLGLQVVAEGVETEAQRYFLGAVHHCDLLQGVLLCPPCDAAALEARLMP
jgi:diguanylate cyclase (GGDEF)-like protein/PAS domain S-box-containing protein